MAGLDQAQKKDEHLLASSILAEPASVSRPLPNGRLTRARTPWQHLILRALPALVSRYAHGSIAKTKRSYSFFASALSARAGDAARCAQLQILDLYDRRDPCPLQASVFPS